MKLDRYAREVGPALVAALLAVGCAARPAASPSCPQEPAPVGTTTLRSGTLDPSDAPRVGKSQRSEADSPEPAESPKDEDRPRQRNDGRPGGGFSGYK